MSIFSKLLKLFLTVVLMPLVPMAFLLVYYQAHQKENILDNHYNLAEAISSNISHYSDDLARSLFFAPSVVTALHAGQNAQKQLQDAMSGNDDFSLLAVLDGAAQTRSLVLKEGGTLPADHITPQLLSQMAADPRLYIAPVETPEGVLLFEFILPLDKDNFLYGLSALEDLAGRLQQMRVGDTGQVFLVSADGILYSGPAQWGPKVTPEKFKQLIDTGRTTAQNLRGQDENFLAALVPVKPLGVYLAVLQPRAEALRGLYFMNVVVGLFLVAIAMLAYFGALAFTRSVGAPIEQLAEGAQAVSHGDLDHRINEDVGWGEFRELMVSFNRMTADLKDYQTLQLKTQVSQMKEDIFRSVAHDLRAPLVGLQGYIYILQNTDLPDQERKACLARMEEAAKNLAAMLEDVLSVSRVEAGVSLPSKEAVSLMQVLRPVLHILEPSAQAKSLALRNSAADLQVWADPKLLQRILTNLISNAIKFTEKGEVEISARDEESQTVICVRDTGLGMSAEQCAQIFEKNRQFSAASEGYGLGLFISRALARAHGGDLKVCSALGQGSLFTLTLPKEVQA